MKAVFESVYGISYVGAIWIFYALAVVHELEEWNIARFEKRLFEDLPAVHTDRNARAWIGVACLIGALVCAAASLPASSSVSAYIFLPLVFFLGANALQHAYWSFLSRSIAPGTASGLLLILPAGEYVVFLSLDRGLVSPWYVVGLSALGIMAGEHGQGRSQDAVDHRRSLRDRRPGGEARNERREGGGLRCTGAARLSMIQTSPRRSASVAKSPDDSQGEGLPR